ncbi:MAG: isoleucine--tRNA ligase [Gemmatimonadaceae bacterium]|nr:isoleucine--tRNA ligase [Gemmatimonadaceae bacterium]
MTASEVPTKQYALLAPDLEADKLETDMLARWEAEDLVTQTLARGDEEFVFFEGPPTANGRPGIHHVFARTIKDLFCRHRAMKGYHVGRKAGWDTHGLPVEIEIEKQLGISGKRDIEALGVEAFNMLCRESVWKYKGEWEQLSARIGYWLDYSDPYITYSNDYIESVWWSLATLYKSKLLVRGHKILPYCPRCETTLSSHEVAQGYQDVEDPSIYLTLELTTPEGVPTGARILVWTTTPWTLVSNVALAVHPTLPYVELKRRERDDPTVILAEARVRAVLGEDFADRWDVVRAWTGPDLSELRYRRPLDWLPYPAGTAHEVIVVEDFVSADDGTGVVHMAPAFGADDYQAGKRHNLAFLQPVNGRGEFPASLPVVGGQHVKKADPAITVVLEERGVLWKAGTLIHSYPHCWRCGTPLLYYARGSWFVSTTSFKNRMMARNARVNWNPPEVGAGRFGEWLENNVDWALSRDRYWGTPLPIWVCESDAAHAVAIGSYAELAERTGKALPADFDPHKPFIDAYTFACTEKGCAGTMKRVPEVIDTWYDSGSMPFAQWHYPFENRAMLEKRYPAGFIAEGVDQTRGWFYSLLAIATGLGDDLPNNGDDQAAPYRAVVVNDMVLDDKGAKMSKHIGNVVSPWEVVPRHGADAVRLFLIASSQVWVPRRFDESMIRELAGRFFLTLKNVYSGIFAQYANFGWSPSDADPAPADRPVVDRWMLSRLATVEREIDERLQGFDATAAARTLMDFVVDDVSNWYVRLNRGRFYDVDTADSRAAFATLHEVLLVVTRLLAPFAPFVSDWIHRELTGTSVHLAPFRRALGTNEGENEVLERAMSRVRTLAKLGRAAREEKEIKVRQPLSRLVCVVPDFKAGELAQLLPLLASELNVKTVEFADSGSALATLVGKANFRSLGKRFGKRTPEAAKAVEALASDELLAFERGDTVNVTVDGEAFPLLAEDVTIVRHASGSLLVREENGLFAALDPTITPELRREGAARELVSKIQQMRKAARFAVSDRVRVDLGGGPELAAVVKEYESYIAGEVLANEITLAGGLAETHDAVQTIVLDAETVRIALTRVN